jgi:hypothetical protein
LPIKNAKELEGKKKSNSLETGMQADACFYMLMADAMLMASFH